MNDMADKRFGVREAPGGLVVIEGIDTNRREEVLDRRPSGDE